MMKNELNNYFDFDQYTLNELLITKKMEVDWFVKLNNFFTNSRKKSVYVKDIQYRTLRTKNGKFRIPITRFIHKKKGCSFYHPFYLELIRQINNETYNDAIDLFILGLSQNKISQKIYKNAFDASTLRMKLKKKFN